MMIMSNFLAIATVTAALRRTLEESLNKDEFCDAAVTIVRPYGPDSGVPKTGINLYLYMVTPNAALRNADMPNRNSEGRLVQRPQVALDLHYLLTFYGDDKELKPQRLLGNAVRTLNSKPVLTRQMIRDTITKEDRYTDKFLEDSNLADALETVKFTPTSLSLDELYKLWSVFFQTPYQLSVSYIGTVVLIESDATPQSVLPVHERNLYVVPFHQPVIEKVQSAKDSEMLIVAESKLIVRGKKLQGDITLVKIDGKKIKPEGTRDTQITITLPSGLYAGVHGLQVVHHTMMSTPPPHKGVESNSAASVLHPPLTEEVTVSESNLVAFVLHPIIIGEVTVSTLNGTEDAPPLTALKITVKPTIGKDQRVALLLNKILSKEPVSYTFVDKSRDTDKDTLEIPITGVEAADYLVRVQVDGAQSQLIIDIDKDSPAFNQYIGPKVTIP